MAAGPGDGPPAAPGRASAAQVAAQTDHALRRFGALSFFYFAALGLFNPYAPLWFQSLGYSTILIGFIASLQAWTRVGVPYAWGWLGDHSGRRVELIRIAAAGALASALGLLGVREAWWVATLTLLLFLANGGVVPLYEATLAQLLQREGAFDTARYGRVRVWGSVGFIVSVTAFGALMQAMGIAAFPWFVAAMNALLLAAALRLPRQRDAAHHDEAPPPVLGLLRQPVLAWFFASVFFTVLAHTSLYTFFSLYLVSLGYGKAAVGALWAVAVAAEIAFFWTQGRWFARWSAARWLVVVGWVTAARFAAVALAGQVPAVLVLAQLSHALTFGAHHAACIVTVHQHFPGRLRGRGQALYTVLGYGISGVLGGVGGGWLIDRLGYAPVFWAATACALAGAWCARRSLAAAVARVPG